MNSFDFYLYRLKLAVSEQLNLFKKEELSRPDLIRQIINNKPSIDIHNGKWHVGNVKLIGQNGGYFAVGKTTKAIKEKFDEDSGNFIEEEDETSPYTHVIFDSEIGLLAIAKKIRLSPTITGITNRIRLLLQSSELTFPYGATISIDPISDPKDFIDALESAYSIRNFTVTFTRPNPFDVDEFFQKPMEKYLEAAEGDEGKTTIKGENLDSETLINMTKSVAATGNDAFAYLKPSQKERQIRKSLKSNPAHFSVLETEFDEDIALTQARRIYASVRGRE